MDHLDTKSILSQEAKSIASHNSGGNNGGGYYSSSVLGNSKDNVKVIIRVRPLNEREKNTGGSKKCVSVENKNTIIIEQKPETKVFNFDFVGNEDLEQETVFTQIGKPIADCCLEGYNGSIFAYGQTGAGKTFTIQGPTVSVNGEEQMMISSSTAVDRQQIGLMPRSFEYIFESLDKLKQKAETANDGSNFCYLIRCSYLEIYNEQIMDLLDPSSVNLHIREDLKKGVYVEGLIEENVSTAQEMVELIARGSRSRHVGSTTMNKESSRSHSVLTTIIETKSMKDGGGVWNIKSSRFHIIDLAGSERQKYTQAMGERLKEAGMINKSLSALGNVINSLVDISEGKNRHVHYRDSKLTFLLRDSLGGNSKTVIIANISPSSLNYGETLSTLKFAQRAKLIKNKAVINEDSSGTMQLLRNEINRLKKELAETEKRTQSMGQQCALCKNNLGAGAGLGGNSRLDQLMMMSNGEEQFDEEDEDLLTSSFHGLMDDFESKGANNGANGGGMENSMMMVPNQFQDLVKQKLKTQKQDMLKMRDRVVYLENLLSANLDNLTSQQKFYESEIAKLQQQNKKLAQAVDSYEKQCARDKMIIKFREDRINKLEQNVQGGATIVQQQLPSSVEDKYKQQIADLKKEVAVWKEASDHNAQAAKLFAEKADLINTNEQLKKELKQTPDSLSAQMRSLNELNESLNDYLKQYCEESKKLLENEMIKLKSEHNEKVENLSIQVEKLRKNETQKQVWYETEEKRWNQCFNDYKQEIERMKTEFGKEREEIEQINKATLNQIKNEIQQISENKSEQEKEAQLLKIQLIEKEKQLEKELLKQDEQIQEHQLVVKENKSFISRLEQNIQLLEETIKQMEQEQAKQVKSYLSKLEEEKKQFGEQLNQQSEIFERKLFELEKTILDYQNEREIVTDQCDQLNSKIKFLEQENDTIQKTLLYKQEEYEEIKGQLAMNENKILILNEKIKELQQFSEIKDEESTKQVELLLEEKEALLLEYKQLEGKLGEVTQQKEELLSLLDDIKQEVLQLEEEKERLVGELKEKEEKIENIVREQSQQRQSSESQLEQERLQFREEKRLLQEEKEEQLRKVIEGSHQKEQEKEIELKEREEEFQQERAQYEENQLKMDEQMKQYQLKIEELMKENQQLKREFDELVQRRQFVIDQQANELSQKLQLSLVQSLQIKEQEIKLEMMEQELQKKEEERIRREADLKKEIEQVREETRVTIEEIVQEKEELFAQLSLEQQRIQNFEIKEQQLEREIKDEKERMEQVKKEFESIIESKENDAKEKKAEQVQILEQKEKEVEELIKEVKEQVLVQERKKFESVLSQKVEQCVKEMAESKEKENDEIKNFYENELKQKDERILESEHQLDEQKQQFKRQIEGLREEILQQSSFFKKEKEQVEYYYKEVIMKQEYELKEQFESRVFLIEDQKMREIELMNQQAQQEKERVVFEMQSLIEIIKKEKQIREDDLNRTISQKNQELQVALNALSDSRQDSEQKLQSMHTELQTWEELKQMLEDKLYNQHQSFEQQLAQKEQQIVQQQQQYCHIQQTLNSQQQSFEKQLSQLGEKYEEQRNQWEQKEQQLLDVVKNQDQDMGIMKEHTNKIINEKSSLLSEIQQLKQTESQLSTKNSSLLKEIEMQKKLLDNTLEQLNNEHIRKYQEIEKEHNQNIQQVEQQYKNHCKELSQQISKLKERNDEQKEVIKNSKETISGMVQKENDLMVELEKRINELKEHQENWRKRAQEVRDEKEQLKREWERGKKENENLRELIKLKDRQIEEQLNMDEKDRETIEKIQKENKDLRNQLIKRDFEMKEIVKTIKLFQEDKNRLEKELDKLHRENDQLIGHKNPSQKIQHHLKIKEENNKLREENFRLQEELRRKAEIIANRGSIIGGSGTSNNLALIKTPNSKDMINGDDDQQLNKQPDGGELKKLKKENLTYQETINRLVDHILSQPGLMKVLGLSEEMNEKIQQQSGTGKVKNAMEIISLFTNVLQSKERDIKELQREKKKAECRLDIVEKEKNLCKQQLEILQQTSSANSASNSFVQPSQQNNYAHTKSPNSSNRNRLIDNQMFYQVEPQHHHIIMNNDVGAGQQQQYDSCSGTSHSYKMHSVAGGTNQARLQMDNFLNVVDKASNMNSNEGSGNGMGLLNKKSPSPLYNFKQQKEKENIQSKKDLFVNQRSGSGRRAYLSNGQK